MVEIWKPIKEWEKFYLISNFGRIKSLDRITRNGRGLFLKKGRILKTNTNNKGYEFVRLIDKDRNTKVYIHRLVAEAFLPNVENKKEVNHLDCNPLNNIVTNLEWCTHKENMSYMSKLGRSRKTGEWLEKLRYKNILNGKKVYQIELKTNRVVKVFETIQSVKKEGFEPSCVCWCCKGVRKKHKGYIWRYADDRNT